MFGGVVGGVATFPAEKMKRSITSEKREGMHTSHAHLRVQTGRDTAQEAATREAIRVVQFVRNKALRLWMEVHGTCKNDLQCLCAQLAKEYPFARRLNSQARQASADRAWFAISRFYDNCQHHTPGTKGYPRFQQDNRSVEYKQTGWKLEPHGKHLTFTDGCGIGTVRLVGNKKQQMQAFPVKQIKRVRIVRRADGYYVQFGVQADRRIEHVPSGKQVGIDMGLHAFLTDSDGKTVANPRHLRKAEKRLKRLHRRLSRKQQQSQNRKRERRALAKGYLKVQRQREDFARKTASTLVSSHESLCLRTPPDTQPGEKPQAGEVHQRCRVGAVPRVADLLRTNA